MSSSETEDSFGIWGNKQTVNIYWTYEFMWDAGHSENTNLVECGTAKCPPNI